MSDGEFSVWVFLPDETHFRVEEWVDAARAATAAARATVVPNAARIIITDGGDHTVYEWKRYEGVTWPPPG